jgi:hypothetical protein
MMYQVQRPAYQAAEAYAPTVTDSTPTTPPTFTPADLAAASATKRALINDLPTTCAHCGSVFSTSTLGPCVVELKDGTVIAYCKPAGGCGRSHVLFVQPDVSVPKYEQVCVFEPVEGHPSMEINPSMPCLVGPLPETPCSRCERLYRDHPTGYDTNGWRVARNVPQALPKDWPTYQPAAGTWSS